MKIFAKIMAAALVLLLMPIRAAAADAWGTAIGAASVLAVYKSTLASMYRLGNSPDAQMAARKQDIKENGTDKNLRDVQLVNEIMTRLVNSAVYELKVNSLPFIWNVNDSEKFNAACYPMNYISINRGLLSGLKMDENQIAAVLAHEMTHGIEQHSAEIYAKAMALSMGTMMVGANLDGRNVDWSRMPGIMDYFIAKDIISPYEGAADEGSFYLMTSAGFNPGGCAAAMARMDYYLRYETRDFLEFDAHDKPSDQTFSDHPDTELREEKLSALMTDYSCGHVTVKKLDRRYKVYIDGKEIYTAAYANAASNAYYFAGGLAKAFHDYNSFDGWNFRREGSRVKFLNDDKVFRQAYDLAFNANICENVQSAVAAAYQNDGARQKYLDAEAKRIEGWKKIRAEALAADVNAAKQLRINADIYNDYEQGELALKEIARAMQAQNQDDLAECLAIRGRAKAILKDFAGAVADANAAVAQDAANLYNFLNRADVRRMQGEMNLALADIDSALKLDGKNPITYKLQGDIYDEIGDTAKAEESYRSCYELTKKNPRSIPLSYLEKIDAKAAKKIRKADEANQ